MQLRSLIPSLSAPRVEGSLTPQVTGIGYEARRVSPGAVYFALQRAGFDGHREIEIAISRGAAAIVCEKNRGLRQRATLIEVEDPRVALAEASAAFYGNAGEKLRVVGVSAQAGGWRTAFLLRSLLKASGVKTGLISTLRHEVGERRLPSGSMPESSDIQHLFAEMLRAGCTTCVLEVPEVSLAALRGIPLDILLLGGGDQKYWWNVMRYLNHAPSRRPSCGILSAEGTVGREAACGVLFDAFVTYGRSSAAQVSAQDVRLTLEVTEGTLYVGNKSFPFEAPLVGRENLDCLLGACASAFACDLDPRQLENALPKVHAPPGSLEIVPGGLGFTVFVDEARDERSLEAVLRSVRTLTSGRILLAFGAGERTTGKQRFDLGRLAAKFAAYIILTSDNPGREGAEHICSALAQGLESSGHLNYHFQPSRTEAISEIIGLAQPGDIVLITGKGERTYQELAGTIVPFDDRIVAAEHLSGLIHPRAHMERQSLVIA